MFLEEDGETNQANVQTDQFRQTIYQINHMEVKILTGHEKCQMYYFLLKMETSFQLQLEGDLYIHMFQNLIGVLRAKDNSGNSIKL